MRKVIETQIELEKRRISGDGLLTINDSPDKSSWNESPDTSDNPKVIPANIEMRSLSTLPVWKCVDEVANSANSSKRESFKKPTTTEYVHAVPFSK